jgi:hypothetical protein
MCVDATSVLNGLGAPANGLEKLSARSSISILKRKAEDPSQIPIHRKSSWLLVRARRVEASAALGLERGSSGREESRFFSMCIKFASQMAAGVDAWKVTNKITQGLDLWREEESLSGCCQARSGDGS